MKDFEFNLLRFAFVTAARPALLPTAVLNVGGCEVSIERGWDFQGAELPLTARRVFSATQIDGLTDAVLVEARSCAEQAIVEASRALAIAAGASVELQSRHPLFAVTWPAGSGGRDRIKGDWVMRNVVQRPDILIPMTDANFAASSTADRQNGASLLSQALCTNTAIGRYVALCQLFENAFAKPLTALAQPVADFLAGSSLRYCLAEVEHWFGQRGSAAHGDLRIAKQLADEVEIRRFIFRMQQAAYDVLFNKTDWHVQTMDRRNIWRPTTATLDSPNTFQMVKGEPTSVQLQLYDPFTGWRIPNTRSWLDSRPGDVEFIAPTTDASFEMKTHVIE